MAGNVPTSGITAISIYSTFGFHTSTQKTQLPIYWKIQISNLGASSGKCLSRDNRKSVGVAKGMVVMKGTNYRKCNDTTQATITTQFNQ